MTDLLARHWLTLHGVMVMVGVSIYVIASHTLHQRRHPSAAIAWVTMLVLLPYLALPLYLLFGSRKVVAYRPTAQIRASAPDVAAMSSLAARAQQLGAAMGLPPAAPYQQLNIHEDGTQALQALREMINSAKRTLDVCTFIIGKDALGNEIAQCLMQRAEDGIQVRLLVDGVGIYLGGHPNLKRLSDAGVRLALFVPPLHSPLKGRTNLRNHRKIVISDSEWFWCGGRNLAAEYFEGEPALIQGAPPWVDLSFDLRGALALQAQDRFEQDWTFAAQATRFQARLPENLAVPGGAATAQLVPSGPDQVDDTVYTLLVSGCFNSRRRIAVVTPYFVPDPTLMMALTLAARRGVAVDILLPRKSNHLLADASRHRALRELTAAGARVWFLSRMIHAKAVVIDDELALVGTANLDQRSLFLNYELMVAFYDPSAVQRFAQWIERQRNRAAPYRAEPPGLMREVAEGLVLWLAFQL